MTDAKFDIPFKSPTVPAALTAHTRLQFDCVPGIACFNACCRQADVTLAPYDIHRAGIPRRTLTQAIGLS